MAARLLLLTSPMLRGSDVTALQKLIGTPADGVFGPKTAEELRRFQSMNGLRVDGIATVDFQKRFGLVATPTMFVRPPSLTTEPTPIVPQQQEYLPPPVMPVPMWKKLAAGVAGAGALAAGVYYVSPRKKRRPAAEPSSVLFKTLVVTGVLGAGVLFLQSRRG